MSTDKPPALVQAQQEVAACVTALDGLGLPEDAGERPAQAALDESGEAFVRRDVPPPIES